MFSRALNDLHGFRGRAYEYHKHAERMEGGGSDIYAPPVTGDATPQAPPAWQTAIDQFTQFLGQQNPFFTGAADRLLGQSQGVDPLFDQYRQAQLGLLGTQQQQQVGALQGGLARRGITGSAAINEINKLNSGFNQQAGALSSQIGLQGLGRADQSLQDSLAARSAAITQAGYPAALQIGGTAAQNAGQGGSGGGRGPFGTVLCTLAYQHGDISEEVYRADVEYGRKNVSMTVFRGYHAWAAPLAFWSIQKPWLGRMVGRPLGVRAARHFAYRMGLLPKEDWQGWALDKVLTPICWVIGTAIESSRRAKRRMALREV